jgi:hypothetical protein
LPLASFVTFGIGEIALENENEKRKVLKALGLMRRDNECTKQCRL